MECFPGRDELLEQAAFYREHAQAARALAARHSGERRSAFLWIAKEWEALAETTEQIIQEPVTLAQRGILNRGGTA